jgi:hypothetical protein
VSPLFPELLTAHLRVCSTPELADALMACGFPLDGAGFPLDRVPLFGVEFIELGGQHYTPLVGGHPAIIIPAIEGGELVDLTATGLATRRTVTRYGNAAVLGQEAIDRAKDSETYVYLFSDPIEWLRNRCRGAVVLDWSVARFALADVLAIACATEFIAARIDKELRRPSHVPPLFVREARRAAA